MVEEKIEETLDENETIQPTIDVEQDVKLNPILDLKELSNEDLMEFYSKIDEHIKYLNNNIIFEEEEEE